MNRRSIAKFRRERAFCYSDYFKRFQKVAAKVLPICYLEITFPKAILIAFYLCKIAGVAGAAAEYGSVDLRLA